MNKLIEEQNVPLQLTRGRILTTFVASHLYDDNIVQLKANPMDINEEDEVGHPHK